jgi:hypothetical protein
MATSFTIRFSVECCSLDTGEPETDNAIVSRLDGTPLTDESADIFDEIFELEEAPEGVSLGEPKLEYRKAEENLLLTFPFFSAAEVSDAEVEATAEVCADVLHSRWEPAFSIPDDIGEEIFIQVLERVTSSPQPSPRERTLQQIVEEWGGKSPERDLPFGELHGRLDGMTEDEVIAVYRRLEPLRIRFQQDDDTLRKAWQLWEAVRSQLQRRFEVGSNEAVARRVKQLKAR